MIKLIDDYYLDSDERQYILYKKTIVQSGKNAGQEVYGSAKYYTTLLDLFKAVYEQLQRQEVSNTAGDLKDLEVALKRIEGKFEDFLNNHLGTFKDEWERSFEVEELTKQKRWLISL